MLKMAAPEHTPAGGGFSLEDRRRPAHGWRYPLPMATLPLLEVRTESIRIDAPVGFVWDVLTDVEKYGAWNPLTPEVRTDFKIGSPVHLLFTLGRSTRLTVTLRALEPSRLIAWGRAFGGRWLFEFVREQHLEPVGKRSCRYHNTERLAGVLAPLMFLFVRRTSHRLLTAVGAALKRYSEAEHGRIGRGSSAAELPSGRATPS